MARPDQQPQPQPDEPLAYTQIQLPELPQTVNPNQAEILNNSESNTLHAPIRTVQVLAIVSLTIRVVTWLCLLASLIVLATNTTTIKDIYTDTEVDFNNVYAYRYMMSAIVIGFVYTCVQVLFEIYQLAMGKSLTIGNWVPKIIFYGDKFLLSLLATGVGAAFGATLDLKKGVDRLDDAFESYGVSLFSVYRSKLDNFFNMGYVSAAFLLIAFLSSVASSILSSLALQ